MSEQRNLITAVEPEQSAALDVQTLIREAIQQGSMDTVERLVAVRQQLKEEAAREAYFRALSAFQSECPEIPKSKKVHDKHGNYRYSFAPLDVIVAKVKQVLQKHGFSYVIRTRQGEDHVTAVCQVNHVAGHTEETEFTVPIDPEAYMNAQQKPASALTYAKRYAFVNAFGIMTTDEDDDANVFNFESGVRYAEYIKALEQETDREELRKLARQYHSELKDQGDHDGAKVVLEVYNRLKGQLGGSDATAH